MKYAAIIRGMSHKARSRGGTYLSTPFSRPIPKWTASHIPVGAVVAGRSAIGDRAKLRFSI
jgi:hypothetical protein